MTELALAQKSTDLMVFAEEALQVHKIAQALATTAFVPASMKGKPDDITGAILFGRELGMDPMTALQTINVIQGRPTLTANAMRGLAMASGVTFRVDESTETRCVMSARRFSNEWTTVTWTIDQAKKMNLLTKENWQKQPGAMLIARATSQLCRLVAANILIGLPYSTEELRDLDEQGQPIQEEKPPAPKKVMRRSQPYKGTEPEPLPELATGTAKIPDQPQIESAAPAYRNSNEQEKPVVGYSPVDDEKRTEPEEPVERTDMVTTGTRKALMATFNEVGIRDRTARLVRVSEILGREVLTVNQVTEAEARHILDVLNGWPDPAVVPQ